MEEARLLGRLRERRADALERAMERYGGYVYTVARNRAAGMLPQEDLEEIASDVFLALWQAPERVPAGKLRPWLGALARNKTVDRLRRLDPALPLEEDTLCLDDAAWSSLEAKERARLARQAVDQLCELDRQIFIRYYDLCQSTGQIAQALDLSRSVVKVRLHRGRKQLKAYLEQRGFTHGDEI